MKNKILLFLGVLTLLPLLVLGCGYKYAGEHENSKLLALKATPEKTEESDLKVKPTGVSPVTTILPAAIASHQPTTFENIELFFNKPKKPPQKVLIKVFKALRVLELYGDGNLMGRFNVALGSSPEGDKCREGDCKTPEGHYYICNRSDESNFKYFLGLSYPNTEDAQRGLDSKLIGKKTYERIKKAILKKQQPPWDTALGGAVGIHGGGNPVTYEEPLEETHEALGARRRQKSEDWTLGCIALSNEDIEIIWKYASAKTPVEIFK